MKYISKIINFETSQELLTFKTKAEGFLVQLVFTFALKFCSQGKVERG